MRNAQLPEGSGELELPEMIEAVAEYALSNMMGQR